MSQKQNSKTISKIYKSRNILLDILDEKAYDNEGMKWIVKHCKEYFVEYKSGSQQ